MATTTRNNGPLADTIAAISTPAGVGGIAVIRLSGSQACDIVRRHCPVELLPRHAHFTSFKCDGRFLDEVVVTHFPEGHSYTGETMVEISCHGSLYVQQALLTALTDDGARLAEPGEFTQRAFLNGRLDLSQSEAVADLIDSTNQSSHALAVSQLRGAYAQRLRQLRQRFLELTSLLELELDFSEEDVEFADRNQLKAIVADLQAECQRLADSFRQGNAIKHGVPVAIVGRPNVGKSTLLNALVGDDRAIVSDTPGTTRDTIEDTLTLGGITFRFIDTAGLRHSDDQIESAGIQRSLAAARKAQVILYVCEATDSPEIIWQALDNLAQEVDITEKHLILLRNKSDLAARPAIGTQDTDDPTTLSRRSDSPTFLSPATAANSLTLSAKDGIGIEALQQKLIETVTGRTASTSEPQHPANNTPADQNHIPPSPATQTPIKKPPATQFPDAIVTNQRHYDALRQILALLPQIADAIDSGLPTDLITVDLRAALYHLGTITGQVASPEILHTIFSRFCIGK